MATLFTSANERAARAQAQRERQLEHRRMLEEQIRMKNDRLAAEKEKVRRDNEKAAQEAAAYNPWGRGGAGAPLRDRNGRVVTSRKPGQEVDPFQHGDSPLVPSPLGRGRPVYNHQESDGSVPATGSTNDPGATHNSGGTGELNFATADVAVTSAAPPLASSGPLPIPAHVAAARSPVRSDPTSARGRGYALAELQGVSPGDRMRKEAKRLELVNSLAAQIEAKRKRKAEEKRKQMELDKKELADYQRSQAAMAHSKPSKMLAVGGALVIADITAHKAGPKQGGVTNSPPRSAAQQPQASPLRTGMDRDAGGDGGFAALMKKAGRAVDMDAADIPGLGGAASDGDGEAQEDMQRHGEEDEQAEQEPRGRGKGRRGDAGRGKQPRSALRQPNKARSGSGGPRRGQQQQQQEKVVRAGRRKGQVRGGEEGVAQANKRRRGSGSVAKQRGAGGKVPGMAIPRSRRRSVDSAASGEGTGRRLSARERYQQVASVYNADVGKTTKEGAFNELASLCKALLEEQKDLKQALQRQENNITELNSSLKLKEGSSIEGQAAKGRGRGRAVAGRRAGREAGGGSARRRRGRESAEPSPLRRAGSEKARGRAGASADKRRVRFGRRRSQTDADSSVGGEEGEGLELAAAKPLDHRRKVAAAIAKQRMERQRKRGSARKLNLGPAARRKKGMGGTGSGSEASSKAGSKAGSRRGSSKKKRDNSRDELLDPSESQRLRARAKHTRAQSIAGTREEAQLPTSPRVPRGRKRRNTADGNMLEESLRASSTFIYPHDSDKALHLLMGGTPDEQEDSFVAAGAGMAMFRSEPSALHSSPTTTVYGDSPLQVARSDPGVGKSPAAAKRGRRRAAAEDPRSPFGKGPMKHRRRKSVETESSPVKQAHGAQPPMKLVPTSPTKVAKPRLGVDAQAAEEAKPGVLVHSPLPTGKTGARTDISVAEAFTPGRSPMPGRKGGRHSAIRVKNPFGRVMGHRSKGLVQVTEHEKSSPKIPAVLAFNDAGRSPNKRSPQK